MARRLFCKQMLALAFAISCGGASTLQAMVSEPKIEKKQKPITEIILENANLNQILMFGGFHSSDPEDFPRISEERRLVTSCLPSLKQIGYETIAVEIYKEWQPDINQFLKGKMTENQAKKSIPFLQDACGIETLVMAKELGMDVVAFDTSDYGTNLIEAFRFYEDTAEGKVDEILFANIKKEILDKDSSKKFIVYCGGFHVGKKPSLSPKPLGMIFDEFSKGKVYSISLEGKEFPDKHINCDLRVDLLKKSYSEENLK